MESQKFPRLKYFMSCYYHQDWALDIGNSNEQELWNSYFECEKLANDKVLLSDVNELLSTSNNQILDTLRRYQSGGRYWNSENDAKQWLNSFSEYLLLRVKNTEGGAST
ncbi:hypothetical protein K0H59_04640 [Shewanella sp. FJAT-51649]|uniref:contact-dependent growth inhibition system immunity protein n=1 Tax=Shewanella sp. FJAT-51649 TaxID=2864210 RepID=UPI001C65FADD|nr:contact-dependent growth inhibition system immunity protein [Shewanella sp. FJAT-51649]QYJ72349.1 hypothetical protein K0H59_04640 [Shewanella sp. FJAT-51649]